MPQYAFTTRWRFRAPLEAVWERISAPEGWPGWWRGVEKVELLEAGDAEGLGSLRRFTWKSALPYRLAFDMRTVEVEKPRRIRGLAQGELAGEGAWTLSESDGWTEVRYDWRVETSKPWMNRLAPLLRPAFAWNHDVVMRWGGEGLARSLGCAWEDLSHPHPSRRPSRRWARRILRGLGAVLALGLAGAGALAVLTAREKRRLHPARPVPSVRRDDPGPEVDEAALMADLRALADPAMEGRRTGTPGSRRAQAWLQDRMAALGLRPVSGGYGWPFTFSRRDGTPVRGMNLLGLVPGTEDARSEGRVMVLSAHYDHLGVRNGQVYPGADDDASGVAALLAVAAHFKAHPPRHTVLFAFFDAEELGLRGSRAFVQDPALPLSRLALDLNLDMVARPDDGNLVACGTWRYPFLDPILPGDRGGPVRLVRGHDRPLWRAGLVDDWTDQSDQGSFHAVGIPFVYFGVEDHPDYHRPTDTPARVWPNAFRACAEIVLDAALAFDRDLDKLPARK